MSFVHRTGDIQQIGGKAFALAQLEAEGLPVPKYVAVSPDAFTAEAESVRCEIAAALCDLGGERFAVRSSAIEEDSADASFAGQLESFLFVAPEDVPNRVAEVWRSGFSDRLKAYRAEHGLASVPDRAPAVLIQQMVNADAAGVAFAADPITGRRSVCIVSAVFGLGTSLVSGDADADTYEVDRDGIILAQKIAAKRVRHAFDATARDGVSEIALTLDQQTAPVLTDEQVRNVAQLARAASAHFGRPQDIEWAYERGTLYLLQSRPITTLAGLSDPDGERNIWDNSNITESYSGVTTPLTFSFARYIYEGVYRQFCRILRVPKRKIAANDQTFRHMLGLIRGRVYYNLLNWYRVLALLPGFTVNRKLMEQMMGVREPLPDDIVCQLSAATFGERLRDAGALLNMIAGLIANYFSLDRQIRRFYARLNDALAEPNPPLDLLRPDELVHGYRQLEAKLLTHWDAPLVNDFFAMIFHGTLRKLTKNWLHDDSGMLANDLARAGEGVISMEPARHMREMAALAAHKPEFSRELREAPLAVIRTSMRTFPEFQSSFEKYLRKFGDRCLEELKLESLTLHDDPLLLLRNVGAMAQSAASITQPLDQKGNAAEQRARKALRYRVLQRIIFNWVLRNARKHVRNRENLRFERTRLFARVRRIFVEIGKRLHADTALDDPRDIFYLTVEEIFAYISGTAVSTDLRALVASRKSEFNEYRNTPAPPDRFETHGPVSSVRTFPRPARAQASNGEERRGLGCCAGQVRGTVKVVRDPRNAQLPPGCILVAERTDPGWVMLFPSARGLLVERGSLLSHSAIVAREMGIPAVVAVAGVTEWLRDGDVVELDGGEGWVRRLKPEEAHA